MRKIAKIKALAGGIRRTQQSLQAAAQILRANKKRLGGRFFRFNQANCRASWKCRKKLCSARRIETENAVKFEHLTRILRRLVRHERSAQAEITSRWISLVPS